MDVAASEDVAATVEDIVVISVIVVAIIPGNVLVPDPHVAAVVVDPVQGMY